ncbi:hypothetical protein CCR75_003043 [Bremia lactucae]|uniref:Uncharacterized protein n=1 Tax=Bremia lactucae TaxID=4779 RepID=A0A976ILZ1_BRELC|nr:hypothetical protein CCR75_003043 [Bremia lactucae]
MMDGVANILIFSDKANDSYNLRLLQWLLYFEANANKNSSKTRQEAYISASLLMLPVLSSKNLSPYNLRELLVAF